MKPVKCPNCGATLPPQEIADGWCENCGKKLPPFLLSDARGDAQGVRAGDIEKGEQPQEPPRKGSIMDPVFVGDMERGEQPLAPRHFPETARPSAAGGRCFFCDRSAPCEAGFFRVGYVNYWIFFVSQRWINVRCLCCPSCWRAFQVVKWGRILAGLGMFAVPMLVCLGIYMPFFAATKDPDFQPGKPAAVTMAFGLLCFPWLLGIAGGFLYMRHLFTGRILPRLRPETEEWFRSRLGGRWGMIPSIQGWKEEPWSLGEYVDLTRS